MSTPSSSPDASPSDSGAAPGRSPAQGREADTSFEALISNARHNLRTPLNQIIGYSEMLQEELADEPGGGMESADLQKIHQAGDQLLVLVNDQLATARVKAGKLDLDGLRRDGRTLLNLIIGYSELCEEEWVEGGHHRFCEDLGKIRLASRNLLDLLHDEALLQPLLDAKPPQAKATSVAGGITARAGASAAGVLAPMAGKLLVVDDHEMNRDMLSRRLERLGHTVLLAENGRQALELLKTHRVDLILLDILMPEMDGMETLGRIKQDEAVRETPVIMLSALDELDAVVTCVERGADDYLQKPFNPVLLTARINACLEKKRLRDQERAFVEELQIEREKSEQLLRNILPVSIAERLKGGETTIADDFGDVTVLFADLVDFTRLASRVPAPELVQMLNEIFSQFDWLVELHGLEKIKTIGDAYMVVGGLPVPRGDHVEAVAAMALDMLKVVARLTPPEGIQIDLRIGMSTGPVVAGIIGSKKFSYDLWGDTVNTASRMESQGEVGRIHVSESTYDRLKGDFLFEERGAMEIKGKGSMTTYFLRRRR